MTDSLYKNNPVREKTYLKYFVSYLLLFTVLVLGFFVIIKSQIIKQYYNQQTEQVRIQMDNFSEQLNGDLIFLSQIDSSLVASISKYSYNKSIPNRYNILNELTKCASSARLINYIVYAPSDFEFIISTSSNVTHVDSIFHIGFQTGKELLFDPEPYFNATTGQMIYLDNAYSEQLLYFPAQSSGKKYIFFYALDMDYIKQQMKNLTSSAMPAIALVDEHKNVTISTDTTLLEPYWDTFELENGIYPMDSSAVCVHTGIGNGFSVISLISTDVLNRQINKAFVTTYMTLLLLSCIGFITILISMRLTYLPLRKLTQKVIPNLDPRQSYLVQLDSAFSTQSMENMHLSNKLNNYRTFMQKELLDSLIGSQNISSVSYSADIDQFFDSTSRKMIFIVKVSAPIGALLTTVINDYLQENLPGNNPCCILTMDTLSIVFLINFVGTSENKSQILKNLLNDIHEEYGYFCAMSDGTNSPLDIPSLYKNVQTASENWSVTPVADFQALSLSHNSFAYPYDKINQLSKMLRDNNFYSTRQCLDELIEILNHCITIEDNISKFYEQSILIDILMLISNNMGQSDIKFESFNNLFFETLHFCRSFTYAEKKNEITMNLHKLIDLYETKISSISLSADQILEVIDECYTQPDFSITVLANQFHISISRMSHLFKDELNVNFSDYLWNLRLNKAKDLLKNTDMPVDKVSISIGYYNESSFRRKFKLETGMTPSQYRQRERAIS